MTRKAKRLIALNKLFPLPVHPFNTQAEGKMSYARWQFEKGEETLRSYHGFADTKTIVGGKNVLDVGCGAGGKSLYYVTQGAHSVTGIDILPQYAEESAALAKELGINGFTFYCKDAAKTDFANDSFDTIIMNDSMEHVGDPAGVLAEMARVLAPGGRLYINFPPYNHPFGAHLSDAIGIPWVHVFFSDATLIEAYKELVKSKPDGENRVKFRISKNENGEEYFSYINKMSIKRFNALRKDVPLHTAYYSEMPLRGFLRPLCFGGLKEYFVKRVVCVFEKASSLEEK